MYQNNDKSSGWTLCPSKTFPGKLYYFNVLTGETAWSVSDSEAKSLNKHANTKYLNYPEPSSHPDDNVINTPNKHFHSNHLEINQPLKTNLISAPIITSTQESLCNSNTNKYIPEVGSPNPFDFSTPTTKADYSYKSTENPTPSNPSEFTIPNVLIDLETPNNSMHVETPCTPSSVTSTIRLPSLKLVIPTSAHPINNIPQYIWAPIPIEYVNDKSQVNGKTNFIPTSQQTVLKPSVKQYPLNSTLNDTEIETSQANVNLSEEEIRPKTDNLELIKKFRDKFSCNGTINSNATVQSNLSHNTEPIKPKIIRKIVKIPEFESKISSKEVFTFQGDVTPNKHLSQRDKVENKLDNIDNISENDLRTILVKRKLESNKNNEVAEKKIRSDPRTAPVTPVKKVTFKLDHTDEETSEEYQERDYEEPEKPENQVLSKLRRLGGIENTEWYIVVDSNVVMESFDVVNTFVQDDPLCKLLIPYSVYYLLSSTSVGDSRGLRRVHVARQTLRRIDVAAKSNHVIVENLSDVKEKSLPQKEQIINCCLKLMFNDIHVVLITDSNILYNEALNNGIHVFKIEEIKDFDKNTSKLSFDIQKFKISVPNDSFVTEKDVKDKPNSNVPNSNLNNERVLNSKSERIRKNLFGTEKSLNSNENNKSILTNSSNLSDISECSMISTNIQKTNKNNSIFENEKSTQNIEKSERVLSTFFSPENNKFKIPNFKNFVIQSKNLDIKAKNTQLKDTGQNDTHIKATKENDTHVKVTRENDTHIKVARGNDAHMKIPNFKNFVIQSKNLDIKTKNTQLKDTGQNDTHIKATRENDTHIKVTKENDTHIKVTRANDTYIKVTKENDTHIKVPREKQSSIFEIDSNFTPVTNKTIENELKRFHIKNRVVQENLEKRRDEYLCSFRQILEGLYDIIKEFSVLKFNGKKIWSIYDVLQVLRKNGGKAIQLIAEKLINLLYKYDYQGTAKMKMNPEPNDLMQIIGCGILLVQRLKELNECPELLEVEKDLNDLFNLIENPEDIEFDMTVPDMSKINKIHYEEKQRKNYIKSRKDIIDYLKKHYSQWKEYEDIEAEKPLKIIQKSSKINVVRTIGKNLSCIKLINNKNMENGTEVAKPKTERENNSAKNEEIQILNDNDKNDLKNQTDVSKSGPIMKRSLNGVTQQNENRNYNLNETKHENTFGTTANGPKIICKMAPIREFETKIKNNLNKLHYSELSNNKSNILDLSIVSDETEVILKDDNIVVTDDKIVNKRFNGEILHSNGLTIPRTLRTGLLTNDSKGTGLLNDGSRRTLSLNKNCNRTIVNINDKTSSSKDGSKRTRPLIKDSKRTLFFEDRNGTPSLIHSSSILNDEMITIGDDNIDEENSVQFVKSFLMKTLRSVGSIIKFCTKCFKVLNNKNPTREEIELIKVKAIRIQHGTNKLIIILKRIINREEKEGTLTSLFNKHGNNLNYMNIIEKCLEQVNSVEYTVKLIILQTL